MNQILANKKVEIDQLYEEDKSESDLDSHRGSFREFYGLQKVMQNIDGGKVNPDPPSTEAYVTGTITAFNRAGWNDDAEAPYGMMDGQNGVDTSRHLHLAGSEEFAGQSPLRGALADVRAMNAARSPQRPDSTDLLSGKHTGLANLKRSRSPPEGAAPNKLQTQATLTMMPDHKTARARDDEQASADHLQYLLEQRKGGKRRNTGQGRDILPRQNQNYIMIPTDEDEQPQVINVPSPRAGPINFSQSQGSTYGVGGLKASKQQSWKASVQSNQETTQ